MGPPVPRKKPLPPPPPLPAKLIAEVHARLFREDIEAIKASADRRGLPWQIALRMLVHRAIKEQKVTMLEIDP